MPIEDALKRAFSHNREYLSALEELNNASARITEARAGAFPVLSFSGGYTRNWEPNEFVISMNGEAQHLRIGTDNTFSAGLRFTQPLYLGGKVGTALKIAKIYKNYSLQNLVTVYNKVRLDVYKSYYGLVLANEVVRVAEQAHILATASREVVEKMAFQGVVSEYDLLRAKVAESNTIPAEIRAALSGFFLAKSEAFFTAFSISFLILSISFSTSFPAFSLTSKAFFWISFLSICFFK